MTPCSLSPETMVIRIESRRDAPSLIWTMFLKTVLLLTLTSDIVVVVSADGLNPILSASGAASEAAGDRLPGAAERRDISAYCRRLLAVYGQRYAASVDCLVLAARPVQICQKCFSAYASLNDSYINITSEQMGPGNESCRDSLLSSDRLMLVQLLHNSMEDIWVRSNCQNCINEGSQSLKNGTVVFLATLNQTLTCFEKNQQGNQTELCKNCKGVYEDLNRLYSRLDKNHSLCIDMEDSMNMTRRLWSKSFNCSVPREETVPVIAVSSFMLFLPIIFYLSSFLHSEQKKRKLIHPKRAKSYNSLMNIQDKLS